MAIISCPNCGKSISSESSNCIHCSNPIIQNQSSVIQAPSSGEASQRRKESFTHDFQNFYKGDFKELFSTFFSNPIDGIRGLFMRTNEKTRKTSLILYVSVFLFYLIISYLFDSSLRNYAEFSVFLKIALLPVIIMLTVSVFSFIIKSIFGKADFKNELFTGGLCSIPLALLLGVFFLIKLIMGDKISGFVTSPSLSELQDSGLLLSFVILYVLLMLINIFQQSLKASGTKDGASWYLSPISVIMAIYIAMKIYFAFLIN